MGPIESYGLQSIAYLALPLLTRFSLYFVFLRGFLTHFVFLKVNTIAASELTRQNYNNYFRVQLSAEETTSPSKQLLAR